ncbi:MAG: TetR/AcrR family transcriptional regulator [Microthrixaceae bacterium]
MDAVIACVDRSGLKAFALEDVASLAGCSRATIYRWFPEGRTQLVNETVTREVGAFWSELYRAVDHFEGVEDRLVHGLILARRSIRDNELLQRLVAPEPDDFLPALVSSDQLVHALITGYLRDLILRGPLVEGIDTDDAAEYLARLLMSHIGAAGSWDLDDEQQVRHLVRTQFLAGIIAR